MIFPARCVESGFRALVLAGALIIAGCASTRLPEAPRTAGGEGGGGRGGAHYKIGAPYKVAGHWYAPKVDTSYDKVGVASWYGDEFNGKKTANGEVFDKRRLSAAHKTLPLPTLVEVENLENHKKIIVRVNDRGPFVDNRIIDLSHAAAKELGFERQGIAKVRVRYIGDADVNALAALPGAAPDVRVAQAQAPKQVKRPVETLQPVKTAATEQEQAEAERDRIADLIAGASEARGEVETASAMQSVQPKATEPATLAAEPEATPSEPAPIWVEVAEIDDLNKLEKMRLDIPGAGPIEVATNHVGGRLVQVLRLGPFKDEALAVASLTKAQEAGFGGARIVRAGAGSL